MFGTGKLTSTEIVIRDEVSYERKNYTGSKGELSFSERVVNKASYNAPIARKEDELELLHTLQDACPE